MIKIKRTILSLLLVIISGCTPFGESSFVQLFSQSPHIKITDQSVSENLSDAVVVNWELENINISEVDKFEICLGTTPGGCETVDWSDAGTNTSFEFSNRLQPSTTYFVSIRYVDKTTQSLSLIYNGEGFSTNANTAYYINAGQSYTCALNVAGLVKCWGTNWTGQLGYDDTNSRGGTSGNMASLGYVDLGFEQAARKMSSGSMHSCVILDNGSVKCWGANWNGQLGYDDTISRGHSPGSMASLGYVDLGLGRTAKQISVGEQHTCVILDNGSVKCWGANWNGQLGYDDSASRGDFPGSMALLGHVDLGLGRTAKQISAGSGHTCAILDNDELKCWGTNWAGQLGYDDTNSRGGASGSMALLVHVDLGLGRTAKQISAGSGHTCAILDNNEVKCWGNNSGGQLGYDDTINRGDSSGSMTSLGYVNLGLGRTAKQITTGSSHTCAILDNGSVKCWGTNLNGQLGYDDSASRGNSPGSMALPGHVDLGLGRTAKQISAGSSHSCVILDNGAVKCWGDNISGELGYDDTIGRGRVAGVQYLEYLSFGSNLNVKKTYTGRDFSCAIFMNDQVKCWGVNSFGQLGYDDTTARGHILGSLAALSYVDLGFGRSVKSMAIGYGHVCAILDNDQLKCWGSNSDGQLGYEDTLNRGNAPGSMALLGYVNLGVGRSAKQVSAGTTHTCAILDNNQLKCWGANWSGQLGYDNNSPRGNSPGSMTSLGYVNLGVGRTARFVSAAGYHTCAILDNDQTKCWGTNWAGQLGYDDTISTRGNSPGSMAALGYVNFGVGRTAKSISSGVYSSCAILDNDELKCWGWNGNGQLGYDDAVDRGSTSGSMLSSGTVYLGLGRTAKKVSLYWDHTCAVLDNDQVKCWGANGSGQLGYDDTVNRGSTSGSMASLLSVNLDILVPVVDVTVGSGFSCAHLSNQQMKCWGTNGSGQLGYNDTLSRGSEVRLSVSDNLPHLYQP
jgi:alpha-tubulin suppressor-like RCC1 family protein